MSGSMGAELSTAETVDWNNKSVSSTTSLTIANLKAFQKQCLQAMCSILVPSVPPSVKPPTVPSLSSIERESILRSFRETTTKPHEQESLIPFLGFLQSELLPDAVIPAWIEYAKLEMSKPPVFRSLMTEENSPDELIKFQVGVDFSICTKESLASKSTLKDLP